MSKDINLVYYQSNIDKHQKKGKGFFNRLAKLLLVVFIIFFVVSFFLSSQAILSQKTVGRAIGKLPVVSQIKTILGASDKLAGQDEDRVNFLLMGIGGAGHDGPLLTDTMMLVSTKLSTKQIALTSIPRDLLVKIPNNGWQRINHANTYGETNHYPGGGSALAAKTVEEAFGIPVDYWLRVDFNGFKKLIDDMGGIDVHVERSFVDKKYPTDDHKVMTTEFEKGMEHMDGTRALQFARSRHGNNGEGSDFARSQRQQKIIMAVKDKLLNWKTFTNPNRLYNLYDNIKDNTQTNIHLSQIPDLINLAEEIDFKNIQHHVIDDSPGNLLKPIITQEGAQVLAPKAGDLSELREFTQNLFVMNNIKDQKISLIIANGTQVEGLATYTSNILKSWGFLTKRLINAPTRNYEKTVIYKLDEQSPEVLKILKNRLAANVDKQLPNNLKPLLYKNNDTQNKSFKADFLIVVGVDQQQVIEEIKAWREKQTALQSKNGQATELNEETEK